MGKDKIRGLFALAGKDFADPAGCLQEKDKKLKKGAIKEKTIIVKIQCASGGRRADGCCAEVPKDEIARAAAGKIERESAKEEKRSRGEGGGRQINLLRQPSTFM